MSLLSGERQVAPTREGVRRDHVGRYRWAAERLLGIAHRVVDVACGVGYGTQLLAQRGFEVHGLDRDREALAYAREHYAHKNAFYRVVDAEKVAPIGDMDAAVCFETIEHIKDPEPMLRALAESTDFLLASVPNEAVFPWKNYAFHYRHYTKDDFESLLNAAGWRVVEWWGQEGPESEVERDCNGRTLIAVAARERTPLVETRDFEAHEVATVFSLPPAADSIPAKVPAHVAIVGMGPSSNQYVHICKTLGGRHKYADETWVINALGAILDHDRIFHMDDVRIQQIRADAAPQSNIAAMLEWLKEHPGPIVTSRAHVDYPGLVEFPLEDVLNNCPNGYFNSTAAYAVAYAIHIGVKKISCFGMDYTLPNAHDAEKGRACVEFWLGIAAERGIKIVVPKTTSLLDAMHTQAQRFYGYDTLELAITREGERIKVGFTERDELPTAEEIEAAYDHSAHPNALVEGAE